jgi:hypothetical protein
LQAVFAADDNASALFTALPTRPAGMVGAGRLAPHCNWFDAVLKQSLLHVFTTPYGIQSRDSSLQKNDFLWLSE